jgi:hypothetical protein
VIGRHFLAAVYQRIKSNSVHGAVYLRTELIFGTLHGSIIKLYVEFDRRGGVIWKQTNLQFGPIKATLYSIQLSACARRH